MIWCRQRSSERWFCNLRIEQRPCSLCRKRACRSRNDASKYSTIAPFQRCHLCHLCHWTGSLWISWYGGSTLAVSADTIQVSSRWWQQRLPRSDTFIKPDLASKKAAICAAGSNGALPGSAPPTPPNWAPRATSQTHAGQKRWPPAPSTEDDLSQLSSCWSMPLTSNLALNFVSPPPGKLRPDLTADLIVFQLFSQAKRPIANRLTVRLVKTYG